MIVDDKGYVSFNEHEEAFLVKKLARMMKAVIYFEAEYNAAKYLEDFKQKNQNHMLKADDCISMPYKISFNGQTLISWVSDRERKSSGEEESFRKALCEIEALKNKKKSKWWNPRCFPYPTERKSWFPKPC